MIFIYIFFFIFLIFLSLSRSCKFFDPYNPCKNSCNLYRFYITIKFIYVQKYIYNKNTSNMVKNICYKCKKIFEMEVNI